MKSRTDLRTKITKRAVDALPKGGVITDTEIRGFRARRFPSGTVSFAYRYSNGRGQRQITLGIHGSVTAEEARALAKRYAGEVAQHRDPAAEQEQAKARSENSVNFVLDQFLEQYASKLRSHGGIKATFANHVRPQIGTRVIYDVKRVDITKMLDRIAAPIMADLTLAYLRKAFNWWQIRDDQFRSPIVIGMARTKPGERARDRALSAEEIADVWRALDELRPGKDVPVVYPAYIRLLLLTSAERIV